MLGADDLLAVEADMEDDLIPARRTAGVGSEIERGVSDRNNDGPGHTTRTLAADSVYRCQGICSTKVLLRTRTMSGRPWWVGTPRLSWAIRMTGIGPKAWVPRARMPIWP